MSCLRRTAISGNAEPRPSYARMRLHRRNGFEISPSVITLLGINIQMTKDSAKVALYSVSWNPTKGFSQFGILLEVRNRPQPEVCRVNEYS
jgi:hypothetical protein